MLNNEVLNLADCGLWEVKSYIFFGVQNWIFFYYIYHFLSNIDKMQSKHFEIQCPCYNHLTQSDYSEIRGNLWLIRACASLQSLEQLN